MKAETWHLTFLVAECSVVMCLNIFLVAIIVSNRKLRSRICNLFLANLFLVHIVEGLVGILRSTILYSIPKDHDKVTMGVNLFTTAVILSYLTYIPVTLDRYVAIKHPFLYQQLTYKHVILINSAVWLISIIFGVTIFSLNMDSKVGDAITFGATLIMYALCISANVSIYQVVKIQVKKLKLKPAVPKKVETISMAVTRSNVSSIKTNPREHSETSKERQHGHTNNNENTKEKEQAGRISEKTLSVTKRLNSRSLRSLRICTLIVASFIICWLPHTLHDILKITKAVPTIVYSDSMLARSTLVVAFCNGIIDPVLYVFVNRDLKGLLERFFRRVSNRSRTHTI